MARQRGYLSTRTVWIFCEGTTERLYFEKHRVAERLSRLRIEVQRSRRTDVEGIIHYAVNYRKSNSRDFQKDDLVFCVFDCDQSTEEQLQRCEKLAKDNGIIPIYSNPSFEYWLLCHFGYHPDYYSQTALMQKLREHLPGYEKVDPNTYDHIKERQHQAIANAEKYCEHTAGQERIS